MKQMFKSFSIFMVAFLLVRTSLASTKPGMLRKQAREYIEQVLYSLFAPSEHSRGTKELIDSLVDQSTHKILSNQSYKLDHVHYDTNQLYRQALSNATNFVYNESRKYAYEELSSHFYCDKDIEANKVASEIYNKVWAIINNKSYIDTPILSSYIGTSLRNKVSSLIANSHRHSKFNSIHETYQTTYAPVIATNVIETPIIEYPVYYSAPIVSRPIMYAPAPVVVPVNGNYAGIHVNRPGFGFHMNFKI